MGINSYQVPQWHFNKEREEEEEEEDRQRLGSARSRQRRPRRRPQKTGTFLQIIISSQHPKQQDLPTLRDSPTRQAFLT